MISKISARLQKIAGFVRFFTLVDIGTDHALLPIFLLQNGKIDKAVAADVSCGPLEKGRENAVLHGVFDKIDFVLSDGLAKITPQNDATCVIAGMGGETVMSILTAHIDIAKTFPQLILSPQRNVPDVRRFLHMNGFGIVDEAMVLEDGKFYHILNCVPKPQKPFCAGGYAFGRHLIKAKDPVLRQFIHSEVEKYGKIDTTALPAFRQKEITKYLRLCAKVLEGYDEGESNG